MEARLAPSRSVPQLGAERRGLLSRFGSQAQALFAHTKPKFGSAVAIHKLRETKWFGHEEQSVLCAVLESGFVLEVRAPPPPDPAAHHMFAIAMWRKGKEKTKNAEQIEIYTVLQKGIRKRVVKTTLGAFWRQGAVIRINNFKDKQEPPNSDKDIRAKLEMATAARFERDWLSTSQFAHWARYGETPQEARVRQINLTTSKTPMIIML